MPKYKSGMASAVQYLTNNLKYPKEAEKNGVEGNQGDKQHGRYWLFVVGYWLLVTDINGLWQSDTHEVDVVLDELCLVFQRHRGLLVVVEDVAHHL